MLNIDRIEKTRVKMRAHNIDALLITAMADLRYYTGIDFHAGERFAGLLMTESKLIFLVNKLFPMGEIEGLNILYFDDTQNPMAIISQFLLKGGALGVDKFMASHFLIKLMRLRADLKISIGSDLVDRVKMVKTPDEVQKMIEASRINEMVMADVVTYFKETPAPSELEAARFIKLANQKYGVEHLSFTPIVCYGQNAAEPHHENDETRLEPGNGIIVDMGGIFEGYCSDMTRTFYKGEPTEAFVKAYEVVKMANLKAIQMVKPGVKLSEIDAAARDYITAQGYGEYFTHRTGHGIGADVHEFPDVSAISDVVCEEGMCFSIEPGVYLTGNLGIRIEDLVCVSENGCIVLNRFDKNLITFE